jgi:antitoxin VapB
VVPLNRPANPPDKVAPTLAERLRPLQDRIARRPSTGLEADKAFYDWLNGDE